MNFFSTKVITISPDDKLKEGSLKKESRYRKVWRERWVVLTTKNIYTFEKPHVYENPTETIEVSNIKTVKTDETKGGFCFVSYHIYNCYIINLLYLYFQKLDMGDECFFFEAKTFEEKEGWIGAIGKALIKNSKTAVTMDV